MKIILQKKNGWLDGGWFFTGSNLDSFRFLLDPLLVPSSTMRSLTFQIRERLDKNYTETDGIQRKKLIELKITVTTERKIL